MLSQHNAWLPAQFKYTKVVLCSFECANLRHWFDLKIILELDSIIKESFRIYDITLQLTRAEYE